jgi:8-oxo-dGTP diphosphatase
MPPTTARRAVRALILTDDERVLLCRHALPEPLGGAVWAAPGGRIEPGESPLAALRRELQEEVGLVLDADPPHVWHREVEAPSHLPGVDRAVSDYFLVRAAVFEPRGTMSAAQLAAEGITERRWWRLPEIADYQGPDAFGPADLAGHLRTLVTSGVPTEPIALPA